MKNNIQQFKVSEIRLLPNNPRYTLSSEIDIKNINFANDYNKASIIEKLLDHEGDWKDLYELVKQLEVGFNKGLDQIFVVKGKDGFDYVVEGNRRIMVMNLINDFQEYRSTLEKFKSITLYKKVVEKLEEIQSKRNFNEIEVSYLELEEEKDELDVWTIINTRHAGENKGKRSWPRLKYLYDLKDTFKKYKNMESVYTEISKIFNKSESSIKKDISSSLWVTDMINVYNQNKPKEEKLVITKEFSGASSLELSLSLKIKDEFQEIRLKDIFNISLNIKDWEVNISTIDKKKLYIFLIDAVKAKQLTTRGWKEENISSLYSFLGLAFTKEKTLGGEIEDAKKISENNRDKFQKILVKYDETSNKIIETQKQLLKKSESEINDKIKIALRKMWLHNSIKSDYKNKTFSNFPFLIVSTLIRSTLELLSYYVISNSDNFYKLVVDICNKIKSNDDTKYNDLKEAFQVAFTKKYRIPSRDKIQKSIYNKYKTNGIYHLFKEIYRSDFVKNNKMVEYLFDTDTNISEIQKKKILSESSYIIGMFAGENLKSPNYVIHTYHRLNESNEANLIFGSLTRQLDILHSIIRLWILGDD